MLVYVKEKIQEVYSVLLFHALISKDFSKESKYCELFFIDRDAVILIQGPDLGRELTFLQERQRGHPDTLFLLFRAKQFEICAFLEEFANPQETDIHSPSPSLSGRLLPRAAEVLSSMHTVSSLCFTAVRGGLLWFDVPSSSPRAALLQFAELQRGVRHTAACRLVWRSPVKGSFYSF